MSSSGLNPVPGMYSHRFVFAAVRRLTLLQVPASGAIDWSGFAEIHGCVPDAFAWSQAERLNDLPRGSSAGESRPPTTHSGTSDSRNTK